MAHFLGCTIPSQKSGRFQTAHLMDILLFYAVPSVLRILFDILVLFRCYRSVIEKYNLRFRAIARSKTLHKYLEDYNFVNSFVVFTVEKSIFSVYKKHNGMKHSITDWKFITMLVVLIDKLQAVSYRKSSIRIETWPKALIIWVELTQDNQQQQQKLIHGMKNQGEATFQLLRFRRVTFIR